MILYCIKEDKMCDCVSDETGECNTKDGKCVYINTDNYDNNELIY